jgi:hypothetical protein
VKVEENNLSNQNCFALRTREEVDRFSQLFSLYYRTHFQMAIEHISLLKAFDQFQSHQEPGRLFTAMLDVHINLNLVFAELQQVGGTWNKHFSKGKLEGGSVIDSKEKFFGKMKIHQHSTAFVLRYRAIWDKLMGFLILAFLPARYDDFRRAKSRKRMFIKLAQSAPEIGGEFAKQVSEVLDKFDQRFRTPEAHGTGALRKWTFTMDSMEKNPQVDLWGYWNALNNTTIAIAKLLNIHNESPPINKSSTIT